MTTDTTKNLYYVCGYHWHNNEWWRFAVSAPDAEAARDMVRSNEPKLNRVSALFICATPDDVYKEI